MQWLERGKREGAPIDTGYRHEIVQAIQDRLSHLPGLLNGKLSNDITQKGGTTLPSAILSVALQNRNWKT